MGSSGHKSILSTKSFFFIKLELPHLKFLHNFKNIFFLHNYFITVKMHGYQWLLFIKKYPQMNFPVPLIYLNAFLPQGKTGTQVRDFNLSFKFSTIYEDKKNQVLLILSLEGIYVNAHGSFQLESTLHTALQNILIYIRQILSQHLVYKCYCYLLQKAICISVANCTLFFNSFTSAIISLAL